MENIVIYSDGSARSQVNERFPVIRGSFTSIITSDNVLLEDSKPIYISEGFNNVTNNQMEVMGFIIPMIRFNKDKNVHNKNIKFYSDSQYLIKGINEWLPNWKSKNWKGSNGKTIKNLNEWKIIDRLYSNVKAKANSLELIWVRGHNGNPGNERCDQRCTELMRNMDAGRIDAKDYNTLIRNIIENGLV